MQPTATDSRDASGIPPSPARRALDVAASAALLALLVPALLAVAVAVRLSGPGPVLYRQLRVGQGGRPFLLLKFRSMRTGAPAPRSRPAAIRGSPGSARSCAAPAWTSSRSCGTSCAGR